MADQPNSEFERAAEQNPGGNLITDFWYFLLHNK